MLSLVYSMVWSYREKLLIGLRHFSHCTLRVVLSLSWSIAQPIKHFLSETNLLNWIHPYSLSQVVVSITFWIFLWHWPRDHKIFLNTVSYSNSKSYSVLQIYSDIEWRILKVVLELKTFKKFLHFINEIFMFMKMKVKSCKQNYQIHFSIFHFIINYQFM